MDLIPRLTISNNKQSLVNGSIVDALNVMVNKNGTRYIGEYEVLLKRQIELLGENYKYTIVGCITTNDELVLFCNREAVAARVLKQEISSKQNSSISNINSPWVIIKDSPVEGMIQRSLVQPMTIDINDNCILVIKDSEIDTVNLEDCIRVTDWKWNGGIVKGTSTYNDKHELIVAFTEIKNINLQDLTQEELVPLKIINLDNNTLAGTNMEIGNDSKYSINPNMPLTSILLVDMLNTGRLLKGVYYYFVRYRTVDENCTNWQNVGQPIVIHECSNKTLTKILLESKITTSGERQRGQTSYAYNYEILNNDVQYCNKEPVLRVFRGDTYSDVVKFPYIELAYVVQTETDLKCFYIDQYKIDDTIDIYHTGRNDKEYDIDKLLTNTIGIYNPVAIDSFQNRLYVGNYRELNTNRVYDNWSTESITPTWKTETFNLNSELTGNYYNLSAWKINNYQICCTLEGGDGQISRVTPNFVPLGAFVGNNNLIVELLAPNVKSTFEKFQYTKGEVISTATLSEVYCYNGSTYGLHEVYNIPAADLCPEYIKSRGYVYICKLYTVPYGTIYREVDLPNAENGGFTQPTIAIWDEIRLSDLRIVRVGNDLQFASTIEYPYLADHIKIINGIELVLNQSYLGGIFFHAPIQTFKYGYDVIEVGPSQYEQLDPNARSILTTAVPIVYGQFEFKLNRRTKYARNIISTKSNEVGTAINPLNNREWSNRYLGNRVLNYSIPEALRQGLITQTEADFYYDVLFDINTGTSLGFEAGGISIKDIYSDYEKNIPLYSSNQKSLMPGEVYKFNIHFVFKDGTYSRGYSNFVNTNRTYKNFDMTTLIKDCTLEELDPLRNNLGEYPLYTVINNATEDGQFGYYKNEKTGEEFFKAPEYNVVYSEEDEDVTNRIIALFDNINIPNDSNIVGIFFSYDEVDSIIASTGLVGNLLAFNVGKEALANLNPDEVYSGRRTAGRDVYTDRNVILDNSENVDKKTLFYYDNRIFLDKKTIAAKVLVLDDFLDFAVEELAETTEDSTELTTQVTMSRTSASKRGNSASDNDVPSDSTIARPGRKPDGFEASIYTYIKDISYLAADNGAEARIGREETIRIKSDIQNKFLQTVYKYNGSARSTGVYPLALAHLLNIKTNIYAKSTTRKVINLGYNKMVIAGQTGVQYGYETYNYAYDTYITRDSHLVYTYNGMEYDEDNGEFVDPLNNLAYSLNIAPFFLLKYFKYSKMQMETRSINEAPEVIFLQSNKTYNTVVLPAKSDNLFKSPVAYMSLNDLKVLTGFDELLASQSVSYFSNTFRESIAQGLENQRLDWKVFPVERYKNVPTDKGVMTNICGIGTYLLMHTEGALYYIDTNAQLDSIDSGAVTLGAIDVFEADVKEILTSKKGYAGLQSPFGYVTSEFGYGFIDLKGKAIYNFDSGKLDILSDKDISERLLLSFTGESDSLLNIADIASMGVDSNNNRYIIKIPSKYDGDNGYLTLTYHLKNNVWASRHSYNPYLLFNTHNRLFSLYDNKIFEHGQETNIRGINYLPDGTAKRYPYYIDVLFNNAYDIDKKVESIQFNVPEDKLTDIDLMTTINKMFIISDRTSTGNIKLTKITSSNINSFDQFKSIETFVNYELFITFVNGNYQVSGFYDRVNNFNIDYLKADGTIDVNIIDDNLQFPDTAPIHGKYFIVRLEASDEDELTLLFDSLKLNCTSFYR